MYSSQNVFMFQILVLQEKDTTIQNDLVEYGGESISEPV